MRKFAVSLLGCLMLGAVAIADVAYMSDGKVYRGKITRQGDNIRIETAYGTVEVPAANVVHITASAEEQPAAPTASAPAGPATRPSAQTRPAKVPPGWSPKGPASRGAGVAPAPVAPAPVGPAPVGPAPVTPAPVTSRPALPAPTTGPAAAQADATFDLPVMPVLKQFSIDRANDPDPVVFMLMRNLSAAAAGGDSFEFRKQLERWQGLSHDRRRKLDAEWISPADYARHRKVFESYLAEAKEAEREVRKRIAAVAAMPTYATEERIDPRTGRRTLVRVQVRRPAAPKQPDHLHGEAIAKLRLAAKSWPDPLLRNFLMAIVDYKARDYLQAEGMLRQCCAEAPRVAGFYQAYGMVMQELHAPTRALGAYARVLQLESDSREAIAMLQEAMQKVPGSRIRDPGYIDAQRLLAQYDTIPAPYGPSGISKSTTWLMPGKTWRSNEDSLPIPAYDRLVFRQAVGVPIGQRTLLVDEEALKDAVEVFVRIDDRTIAPADVRNTGYGTKKGPGLSAVNVEGYTFTSVASDEKIALAKGQGVVLHGLGIYEMMGLEVRRVPAQVESAGQDPAVKLSCWLAPGEGAGPVLTPDGQLVGFLAGKTDVKVEGGGPDRFIPLSEISNLIDRAKRSTSSSPAFGARARRKVAPKAADGKFFVVYVTVAEKFD